MKVCMLSTVDNPFNPFDEFLNWFMYDSQKHYDSCSFVARQANLKPTMSQIERERETERVIDEIIANDFLGIRIKVEREV